MKRSIVILVAILLTGVSIMASASLYSITVEHGTPGVITREPMRAKMVLTPTGDCKKVSYVLIIDDVKAVSGSMDLSKQRSIYLDYGNPYTLTCNSNGVMAQSGK